MNAYIQLNFHIKLSHIVNNTLHVVKKFLEFNLDVQHILSIQVQMLLRSPPICSFYLCKAWVHKADICTYFKFTLLIIYQYVVIETLFEDYTIEPPKYSEHLRRA